ncbi:MAG: 50S ribosomal protein L23 [Thiotrichales bacterium]|jgi:large subunit ribosomal protein L23|nr:50S ribosomal protein L23 [Thiotrichales bacterium]MBT3613754.1 50S ribosomal protein L23 [Thiotrichales bacterium]MBT3752477.1 50S ribosomal protein L23 [Thiotrichales bacterium]MBT3838113.1 50S ribosomal protein L23 [Thiotrichales bacterium]MBT4152646.1 50S ribosomal protein L23 [Thiotrichales bacterium]
MNTNEERLMKIVLAPHVTEKSSMAAEMRNQYVFKVVKDASKPEIKQAVELMFDVKVDGVTVSNVKGKMKRAGNKMSRRASWKKAFVTLSEGQDIDFIASE